MKVNKYYLLFFISINIFSSNLTYMNSLIKTSGEKLSHKKKMWHTLLHYDKAILTSFKSDVDGEKFFFSKKGKTNPKSELRETIKAFFNKNIQESDTYQHPQCLFPLRFDWLVNELNIDKNKLPSPNCKKFNLWKKKLDPFSISIVFASSYLNNPASMYGHVFLKIDNKTMINTPLLSTTISFVAKTKNENILLLPIKGLFGALRGVVSVLPYYMKVKEYSYVENRDLWEYQLMLSQQQINSIIKHIWELKSTYFDYYFIDENCSYHILSLIELVYPDFNFRSLVKIPVLPLEVIKLLYSRNIISKTIYRPSTLSKLKTIKSKLNNKEINLVEKILSEENIDLINSIKDPNKKYLILKSVILLHKYRNHKSKKILNMVRLKLNNMITNITKKEESKRLNPKDAHFSKFIQVGGGIENSKPISKFFYRLNLGDILSDGLGFISPSELETFSFSIKLRKDDPRIYLDKFNLIKITSINPIETWIKDYSWRLWLGAESPKTLKKYNFKDISCGVKTGLGTSFKSNIINKEVYYSFLDLDTMFGRSLDSYYHIGIGISLGFYLEIMSNLKFNSEITYFYYFLGDNNYDYRNYKLKLGFAYTLKHIVEFRFFLKNFRKSHNEAIFSIGFYF